MNETKDRHSISNTTYRHDTVRNEKYREHEPYINTIKNEPFLFHTNNQNQYTNDNEPTACVR